MIDGGRMLPEYRRTIEQVEGNLRRYRKLLSRLKGQKPRGMDDVFRKATARAFEEIDCLACGNCCLSLGPRILERDIDRIARQLKMRPSKLSTVLLRKDEDGDWVFREMPCPFLGEDNCCSIYPQRPKACREYPHTDEKNIHRLFEKTIKNAVLCPIAARVLQLVDSIYGGN